MDAFRCMVRRRDFRSASKVQCGIAIQALSGDGAAIRYLEECGLHQEIINRVLFHPNCRRHRGETDVFDRRMSTTRSK
jgi:hypothetical protein